MRRGGGGKERQGELGWSRWKENRGEAYVSLGKLAEMSNSGVFASNPRSNKTTPSRGACTLASLPPPFPCLRCLHPFSFVRILHRLYPPIFPTCSCSVPVLFSSHRTPSLSLFLVSSTSTTIRRQRLRHLTLRAMLHTGKASSYSLFACSLPPFLSFTIVSPSTFMLTPVLLRLFRISHGARWKSRERPAAMLTKYSPYSPGNSRIVCFDVHIYLTGISTQSSYVS